MKTEGRKQEMKRKEEGKKEILPVAELWQADWSDRTRSAQKLWRLIVNCEFYLNKVKRAGAGARRRGLQLVGSSCGSGRGSGGAHPPPRFGPPSCWQAPVAALFVIQTMKYQRSSPSPPPCIHPGCSLCCSAPPGAAQSNPSPAGETGRPSITAQTHTNRNDLHHLRINARLISYSPSVVYA